MTLNIQQSFNIPQEVPNNLQPQRSVNNYSASLTLSEFSQIAFKKLLDYKNQLTKYSKEIIDYRSFKFSKRILNKFRKLSNLFNDKAFINIKAFQPILIALIARYSIT